ncbi:hypothetical protein BDR03DRAFT_974187 [Suillus americanus]|nr:hypothetical protein BDR03DRAFT_974187 [Suillus americanus]
MMVDVSRYIRRRQMYLFPIIICYHRFVSLSFLPEYRSRPFTILSVISLLLSFTLPVPTTFMFSLLDHRRTLSCRMETLCVNGASTSFV